jgi:DNA-binding transcriptional LysR family regulator
MNELECIRAFVKVVEVGSFAETARQMNTAKSVITKRVNQLEDHLELQLLRRSTRKLTITEGGADFYERAVHVLSELDDAKTSVSGVEWGLTGTFRVSCISSFIHSHIADDLCEFQNEHPELTVELEQHDRFCHPVQEGFDVCLQTGQNSSGILEASEIFPVQRLIVATPEYIKNNGLPLKPDDLPQHRFCHNTFIEPDCCINLSFPKGIKPIPIKPKIQTNTIWMLRAAILSNQYMAVMPAFFIAEEIISGRLVAVLPEVQVNSIMISAFYRRSSFVPMKVRIFIDFLRRKYGDKPPWEKKLLDARPELSIALGSRGTNKIG